jgi:hypothetical protein
VRKGLEDDFWISNLIFEDGISDTNINEFSNLWIKIQEVQLTEEPRTITLQLTNSGIYTPASAYLEKFDVSPTSFMKSAVWANLATPKFKKTFV